MYRAPRGTADVLPEEQPYWRYVEGIARDVARRFGYGRLDTPVFESSGLFVRGVGQVTDIVEKEMYTFEDRGGDHVALRPEGTAPVCRAYLEHGMRNLPQPVRLFYFCPIFRYDRPQAGRYRQHHQFGVEAIGDADPSVDAEIIELAWRLMSDLGLKDLSLLVNSIGDANCRPAYLEQLRAHYAARIEYLCNDCKLRLERNPLRLLDCKQPACIEMAHEAPRTEEHLCPDCRNHWERLLGYLRGLDIPYRVEPRLVRGLDYYSRTVFEIQPPEEGGQTNICGGGRYDGLMEQLEGPPTPGIGFGAGMERIILNLKRQGVPPVEEAPLRAVVIHLGEAATERAVALASDLRSAGLGAVLAPAGRSLRAQLRYANSMNVPYALILGDDELSRGVVVFRDMSRAEQREVPLENAPTALTDACE
ncbi:MAG: histidine--tRNA ligase [Chloroflexota bacterium]|nr:histidine--tRNA ligase [Chloroflexota bacterium]MDE2941708.1 histidine--tRNA ligase [Chloroflexota bacterium]MDE3267158.1 histidine--tRNA ligase [Chloroflexota bacterium]